MLVSYLKIAWRNLLRQKLFTLINILGLSAGIGFVLLIGAFIYGEKQVNKTIPNNDRIFLLRSNWKQPDMGMDITTPAPLGQALKQNYPHLVEDYYHHDGISSILSKGDKHFREVLQPGDPSLLTMFGFPVLHGNAKNALNDPYAIVLTANRAIKYFGRTNVVGETLTMQSFSGAKQDFTVTAVLKNLPYNTVNSYNGITAEIFLSDKSLVFFGRDASFKAWTNAFIVNYVQLKKGVKPEALLKPIQQLIAQHAPENIRRNSAVYLSSLNDYYMQLSNGIARRMVITLAFVAAFILLMAVINFVNISIGSSVTRLKEIGVRKVMGSTRRQLIIQFLSESLVLVSISVVIALFIYQAAAPFFTAMLGRNIPSLFSFPVYFCFIPLAVIVIVSLLAGIYPAFVLSLQPSVDSLKGKLKTVKEKVGFRRSLITVQFTTAMIVFVAAVVISQQVSFVFNNLLGYDKEYIVTASLPRNWNPQGIQQMQTVRNELTRMPEVAAASFSYEILDGASGNQGAGLYKAGADNSSAITTNALSTDEYYAATYRIPMVAGKYLTNAGNQYDSTLIVINEAAAKALGWQQPAGALGQQVRITNVPRVFTVGGVIKDFHFGSMHDIIRPLYLVHVRNTNVYRYMSFKLKPGNIEKSLQALQKKWAQLMPGAPFEYTFFDDTLAKMYSTEIQMRKAAEAATALAMVIVLSGVIGIISISLARRIKELGIRKVLGASVIQIVGLFIKEFAWVMVLAALIACPVAWFILHKWLTNFAYHITIGPMPFLLVAGTVIALTALVITGQTIQKALMNPVKSLRTE